MNENNDMMMLDAVERYIRGEMNPDERLHFENLRKTNAELDQLVVEHTLFLQQMNRFGETKRFQDTLNEVHSNLSEQGKINTGDLKGTAKVVHFWNRYKRVTGIAASIAGITALTMSVLVWSISPNPSKADIENLNRKMEIQEIKTSLINDSLQAVKNKVNGKPDINSHGSGFESSINFITAGTGFMIDAKGMMITNAHVVKDSRNIRVVNNKGEEFNAFVVQLDPKRDVAIIKIDDSRFKPHVSLPYGIRKTVSDLAEPIFTLGFPRNEIVYGEGYLSSRTGYHGDTLSCQITVPANPGNSGGPIFNQDGEVIGILSSRQRELEGAVFAIQSKYIYQAIEQVKQNNLYQNVKLSAKSNIAGLNKKDQVKKIEEFVFMVKGD